MLQLQRVYTHKFLTHEKQKYKNTNNKVKMVKKNECGLILLLASHNFCSFAIFSLSSILVVAASVIASHLHRSC